MNKDIDIEKFYYEELTSHNYEFVEHFEEGFEGKNDFDSFDQAYNFSFRKMFRKMGNFGKLVGQTFLKVAKKLGKVLGKLSSFALGGIALFLAIANLKRKRPQIIQRLKAAGYKNVESKGFFWQVYSFYFTIPRKKVGEGKGFDGSHIEYFVFDFDEAQRQYNLSEDQKSGVKAGADAGNSALRGDIIGGAMKVVEWIVKTIFKGKKPNPESQEANQLNNSATEDKLINDPQLKEGQSAVIEAEKKGIKESDLLADIKDGIKIGAESLGIQTNSNGEITQGVNTETSGINSTSTTGIVGGNNIIIIIIVVIVALFLFSKKQN